MDNLFLPNVTLSPELLRALQCAVCEARYEMKCTLCGGKYCHRHLWMDDFYRRKICINCLQKYKVPSLVILVEQESPCFVNLEDRIVAVIFDSGRRLCLAAGVQEEPDYLATDTEGRILIHRSWVAGGSNGPHYIMRGRWPIADVKMLMTLDNWKELKDKSFDEIITNYRHLLEDSWKYRLPRLMRP
jgi:hypothetical protein